MDEDSLVNAYAASTNRIPGIDKCAVQGGQWGFPIRKGMWLTGVRGEWHIKRRRSVHGVMLGVGRAGRQATDLLGCVLGSLIASLAWQCLVCH